MLRQGLFICFSRFYIQEAIPIYIYMYIYIYPPKLILSWNLVNSHLFVTSVSAVKSFGSYKISCFVQNSRKIWQLGYELWLKIFGEIWMKNGFPGDILATTPDSIVWKKSKYVLAFDIIPWRWSNERSWNQPWRKKTCLPHMSTHFCITGPSVRETHKSLTE